MCIESLATFASEVCPSYQSPVQAGGNTTVMGLPGARCETGQLCSHRKRPHAGAGVELGRGPTAAADGHDEGAVPEAQCSAKV